MNDGYTLRQELARVSARYRRLLFWRSLAVCWVIFALAGAVALAWARFAGHSLPRIVLIALCASPLLAVPWLLAVLRRVNDPIWIAHRIEGRFPDLDTRLLAALEQKPDGATHQFGFLQRTVIEQAMAHARFCGWERALVPGPRLGFARVTQWAALLLLVGVIGAMMLDLRRRPAQAGSSWLFGGMASRFDVKIEPEDTELERGTSLLVLARFGDGVPGEVEMLYRESDGTARQMAMSKSLDDPVFAARLSSVKADLTYAVHYGDAQTRWFKVGVFDYPDLKQADVTLKYPTYTGLPDKLVKDTRSVTAVEGTSATFVLHLNKPVAQAQLIPRPSGKGDPATQPAQPPVALTVDPNDPTSYSVTFDLKESQRFRLELVDAQGRKNKQPPAELAINVTTNQPPKIELAWPGGDVDVSPLEEVNFKASVRDDFGVRRAGLSYSMAGGEPKDVVLADNVPPNQKRDVAHLVALEKLSAEPDQLLSYYFWAEDTGPDGSVRRTAGDMYFAEVRPFEEIYRQGQQPAGGQQQQQQQQQGSQNAQDAQDLAELQKQIVSATWKVIRRETSAKPTALFVPDVKSISESQGSARQQASGLGERLQDARSKAYLESTLKHMDEAKKQLDKSSSSPAIDALTPALSAEQAAYQDLLKLRAREHEVVRGNQQGGQQNRNSSQQRRQRQLNQLDLTQERNRYETQRNAANQQEQDPAQRETRQVLNRLRELAQRQEDLNRQMRELQAALEKAREQAQKEEIQRQLARLRDQQQEQLRETDELRDRMDQPENQDRMADSRQQVEQTREDLRRASEQLEQGRVPEAAASGARASEQLNQLRDQFRKAAAGQFDDAMNQMRDDAQQLDKTQQELSQKLDEMNRQPGDRQSPTTAQARSLRDGGERDQVAQGLAQQRERLDKLSEEMRKTIEEAETPEPLLSKQLDETLRQSAQQNPERALDTSRQLLDRGFTQEARQAEADARKSISQLREGIEKAADSVLGDQTESLRRARNELDQLARELNNEVTRNQPATTQPGAGGREQLAMNGPATRPNGPTTRSGGGAPDQQPNPEQADAQAGGGQQQDQQQASARGDRQGGQRGSQQANARGQQQGGAQQGDGQAQQGNPQVADARGQQPGRGGRRGGAQRGGARAGDQQQAGGLRQQGGQNATAGGNADRGDMQQLLNGGGPEDVPDQRGPITGTGFRDWSDRLRDVEEMVNDPQLRGQAAQIRDRVRAVRSDFNRHTVPPNWDMVSTSIVKPLVELRDSVNQELMRRQSAEALVPIDREPVPTEYAEQVRQYYERLGSGR